MRPRPLFKYMRKEHALALLERGHIRIGTLYEYRNVERYGTAIGDTEEGVKNLHLDGSGETWDASTIPEFARTFFNLGPGGAVTLQPGIRLDVPQQSPEYFLFCASSAFDKKAMQAFGYDSCVVIEDPSRFFKALSHTFRHKGSFEGVYECQYGPRSVPYDRDDGMHPALIKDPAYAYQKEVRALWRPRSSRPVPKVVESQKAAKWCSAGLGL